MNYASTPADYFAAVTASDAYLDEAQELIPADEISRVDVDVTDLDRDIHRMTCSDTTSQYVNRQRVWVQPNSDTAGIIDAMITSYEQTGWTRSAVGDSPEARDGLYLQMLKNADGFGITLNQGSDEADDRYVAVEIFSPCVENPADKPATWGKFDR